MGSRAPKALAGAARFLIAGCMVSTLGFAASAASNTVDVQILSVNDFHGAISQTSKVATRPAGGAAYLAQYLREREAANPNTLLVHAGDMVGASQPVSSLLQEEPTAELMNFMGFAVGTPGNHDFDAGVSQLGRLLLGGPSKDGGYYPGSSFPLISANIVRDDTLTPILPPYAIKVVDGVPIGFIGITTPTTPSIVMASGVKGLKFADPVESINKWVAVLKGKGVKAIMVLAHEDGSFNKTTGTVVGPLADIANGVDDEVDVIFAGHSHVMLNNVVDGKLIVEGYSAGTAFSDVDLVIDRTTGDVISKKADVITTFADAIQPEPTIAKLVSSYEAKVKPLTIREIAQSTTELTRAQSEAGESSLGDLIADAQRKAGNTQIAFMNPGGIRRDLPQGTLTWGVLFECQPFANDLMKFTMTGDQIYRVLNQQWQTPSNRFLQTSGLRYTWDDKRAVGDKVTSVSLEDGTPIAKTGTYTVTANIFIATGGDNFSAFKESKDQVLVMNDLEALVQYLQAMSGPVKATISGRATMVK